MKALVSALDLRRDWPSGLRLYEVIWFRNDDSLQAAQKIFSRSRREDSWFASLGEQKLLVRHQNLGVMHPKASSLSKVLQGRLEDFEVDEVLVFEKDNALAPEFRQELEWSWKEPSIESLRETSPAEYLKWRQADFYPPLKRDDSWDAFDPKEIGLHFTPQEETVLLQKEKSQNRRWTRAEWELFAQTWSEHCKHKIFNAEIKVSDRSVSSIFKTHIRAPSLEVAEKRDDCLSMFYDNAGVVQTRNYLGEPTPWAICAKMETHNSPSAISPFGGAATGIVGVHRDILGTGLGAKPIANWNVLCFEPDEHSESRPENALPPRVIRAGVLRGIEVGGNHSGIPTVQGSVHFDPSFAVKPYVFAGALGLLKADQVDKKARPGNKLYCVGGATGVDGVRGAVMSSRSLEKEDFVGSAVQVANPFVQRSLTDFLIRARDEGLIDSITDNGAGGLASSVGEMALSTGGASIDLSHLRLKVREIPAWIRLLSESQERMTIATSQPIKFEALAQRMHVDFDVLGELHDRGTFEVLVHGKKLVDVSLDFLHEACPRLELRGTWSRGDEERAILASQTKRTTAALSVQETLDKLFMSMELCSREGIVRRFDHEVQGRTLRKPYAGSRQRSPSQAAVIEIPEADKTSVVLTHATFPEMKDVKRATEIAYFAALSAAVAGGAQLKTLAALDNYAWPDPTSDGRSLSQLVDSAEVLSTLARTFEIPFVSGKDSMKNNSATFRAAPAVLISMVASSYSPELIPSHHVQRANDIVALLPVFEPSLIDSAYARQIGLGEAPSKLDYNYVSDDPETLSKIKARLETLSALVAGGNLRSLRQIGKGGLLGSLVKMTFGADCGLMLHESMKDPNIAYAEGVAGFVMTLDPHCVQAVQKAFPDLLRLGVVNADRSLASELVDLNAVEASYRFRSEKGLWK